jgi:hypothetical protein
MTCASLVQKEGLFMGWQTNALFLEGTTIQTLVNRGVCRVLGETLDFATATSRFLHQPHTSVGQLGTWVVIWNPSLENTFSLDLEELSVSVTGGRQRVISLLMHSVSSTYGFSYVVAGTSLRQVLSQEGVIFTNEGAKLAEEAGLSWGSDHDEGGPPEETEGMLPFGEDALWTLLGRLTGDLTFDQVAQAPIPYYTIELVR